MNETETIHNEEALTRPRYIYVSFLFSVNIHIWNIKCKI